MLEEFAGHIRCAGKRGDGRVDRRLGKPGVFIAGADLREFVAAGDAPPEWTVKMCTLGRQLFQRLSKSAFVTVAAIDGLCLGGGPNWPCGAIAG